jgi:hypothetical protein
MREYWGSGYSVTGGGGGGGGGTSWLLLGNAGTNPLLNFVGTLDANDLVLRANSIERQRLVVAGSIVFSDSTGANELFIDDYEAAVESNVRLRVDGPVNDVSLVLEAKGNGATLAQRPDNAATGGNARGVYATDFQKSRGAASQVAAGDYSAILGGQNNQIDGALGFIGGGLSNLIGDLRGVIGGGNGNTLQTGATDSTIGGGITNQIFGDRSTIGGGTSNTINATVSGSKSTIGGGSANTTDAIGATIGGGEGNLIDLDATGSTIGGGQSNIISPNCTESVIGGGTGNAINSGVQNFIGGGASHGMIGDNSVIVGGLTNTVEGSINALVGGDSNSILNSSTESFIGGGSGNSIGATVVSTGAVIGGGTGNSVDDALYATLGGGQGNTILLSGGRWATVGGGNLNAVGTEGSTIAGGKGNFVGAGVEYGTVGGGRENAINNDGWFGTVPGGYQGQADHYGEMAHASGVTEPAGGFPIGGAQHSWVVWRRQRVPGTGVATELYLDGNAGLQPGSPFVFNIQNDNEAYQFEIQVVAKDNTGNPNQVAWWKFVGGIYRDVGVGSVALAGATVVNTGNTGGAAATWVCAVGANAVNGSLQILFTIPGGSPDASVVASGHMTRVRLL